MKATGIVRRIDDLGRVVIPKEIRRTMRIREGDPLEIYTDRDGEVIFKKYSPIGEWSQFATQYADTLYKTAGLAVVICDRDTVIASAGVPRKDYADRRLSEEFDAIMDERSLYTRTGESRITVVEGGAHHVNCAMPIMANSDIIGCVASLSTDDASLPRDLPEAKLIQTAASFLGRQLED